MTLQPESAESLLTLRPLVANRADRLLRHLEADVRDARVADAVPMKRFSQKLLTADQRDQRGFGSIPDPPSRTLPSTWMYLFQR